MDTLPSLTEIYQRFFCLVGNLVRKLFELVYQLMLPRFSRN